MPEKIKHLSKSRSLLLCTAGYLAACVVAAAVILATKQWPVIQSVALADLAATVVIFIFSLLSDNSSFYDPYWSVAPLVVVLYLALSQGVLSAREIIVTALVLVWAFRLTWNWARRWRGFEEEDFRYVDFRKTSGAWYWAVSFLGFHLFPTIIVFLALMPIFTVFQKGAIALNAVDLVGTIITMGAIIIESLSDRQLWNLKNRTGGEKGAILDKGLWSWSRHPNYFGEVLFWCGVFLFSVAASSFQPWLLVGPVMVILLFSFISVPLADRRMKINHPSYEERMKSVTGLMPFPPQHLMPGETIIPLGKRPLDVLILAYLIFNLAFVSYNISLEQIVIPDPVVLNPPNFAYPSWPPPFFVDVVHWWEGNFDPLLLARPVWYKTTIWIDVLLFGPFAGAAIYAFIKRRNWIRLPAIIYSSVMLTNVLIILSEEIWGAHASANPLVPVLANASWIIFPILIAARMWKDDHPFTKRA